MAKRTKKQKMEKRKKVRQMAKNNRKGKSSSYLDFSGSWYSPEKGKQEINIVPYEITDKKHTEGIDTGDTWYRKVIYVHKKIGAEEKDYICPKTIKKKCPICEDVKTLADNYEDNKKEIKALKAKEREIYNVLDGDEIKIWDMSTYLFGTLLDKELDMGEDEYGSFFEVEEGYTLKVRFEDETIDGGKPFLKAGRIDFEERDDLDEDILEKSFDLDNILTVLSYDELNKIHLDIEDDDIETPEKDEEESEEEEEEKPKKKKAKKKPEPEEEDDDEEPEDEDDEEESEEEEPEEPEEEIECPGTFGEDCNEFEICDDCPKWDECEDEQERLKKEKEKKKSKKKKSGRKK